MTAITLRIVKGAPLTNAEIDANFNDLNAGKLEKSSNLADLADVPTARGNLGLGNAATKNVGTAAGTVAAGDHTHPFGLVWVTVAGTTQAAVAGNSYRLTNVAATTVTLPAAPADGDMVGIKVSNGLITNSIDPNGKTIEGLVGITVIDKSIISFILRYSATAGYWEVV